MFSMPWNSLNICWVLHYMPIIYVLTITISESLYIGVYKHIIIKIRIKIRNPNKKILKPGFVIKTNNILMVPSSVLRYLIIVNYTILFLLQL